MDGQKQTVEQVGMPLTNVNPEPRPFQQYVSDVPTGPKVTVRPAMVHLTRQSRRKLLRGNAIILAHILKVPEREMIFAVNQKYSIIRDLAYNFDRTHEESFFESRPQLLVLEDGETPPTTAQLRQGYRDYAARLAMWYYYYETIQPKAVAALVSIMNLSRFNGQTQEKDIAGLCRWSFINRNTGAFAQFPAPTGMTQLLIDNARYAVGSNANGALTLSLPLYDVTVYGNLGNHAGSLREYVSEASPDSVTRFSVFGAQGIMEENQNDSDNKRSAKEFIANEIRTVMDYYRVKGFDILNDSVLTINNGGDVIINHLANDGKEHKIQDSTRGTSITDVLWENYKLWFDLLLNQFSDMRDPTNDKAVLARELGFVEDQMSPEKMMNAVRSQDLYDITSLRNFMRYRSNGKVNTATIVRSNLPFASMSLDHTTALVDAFSPSVSFTAPDVFDANFKRVKLFEGDAFDWVRQAKCFPGITPRVFSDATQSLSGETLDPLVLGALSSDGDVFPVSQGFMDSGKFASFYDMATHNTIDPVGSNVELSAISADDALRLTDQKEGFVLAEDPSQVFVAQSPVIDTSDPFQCGFYLVLANDKADVSDWTRFVRDPGSYQSPIVEDFFKTITLQDDAGALDGIPLVTSQVGYDAKDKTVKGIAPTNGNLPPYSLLFVGDMAFVPPEARSFLDAFAMPRETMSVLLEPGDPTTGSRIAGKQDMAAIVQAAAAAELYVNADYANLEKTKDSNGKEIVTDYLPAVVTQVNEEEGKQVDLAFDPDTGDLSATSRVDWRPRFFLRPGPKYQNKVNGYKQFWSKIKQTATTSNGNAQGNSGEITMSLKSFIWEEVKGVLLPHLMVLVASATTRKFVPYKLQPVARALTDVMADKILQALDGLLDSDNATPDTSEVAKWYFTQTDLNGDGNSGDMADYATLMKNRDGVIPSSVSWWKSEDDEYMLGIEIPADAAIIHATSQEYIAAVKSLTSTAAASATKSKMLKAKANSASELKFNGATFNQGGGMASLALFRLAAKRNPNFNSPYSGSVIEYTDEEGTKKLGYDSAGFIANVMYSVLQQSAAKGNGVKLYMFNPQYGPIAIITDPIPYDAGFGVNPGISDTTDPLATNSIDPVMGNMEFVNGVDPDQTQRSSYRNTIAAAHLWSWMLRAFSFNPIFTGSNGQPRFAGDKPVRFDDAIKEKWVTSLFQQCIVNYAGHGDVKYFNDKANVAATFDKIAASTHESYPIQDIITMPRKQITRDQRKPMPITGPDRTSTSYSTANTNKAYISRPSDDGKSTPEKSPHKRRSRKRRRGGYPESKHENVDRVASKESYTPQSVEPPAIKPAENGGLDASQRSVDERVDKMSKKPFAPASAMN